MPITHCELALNCSYFSGGALPLVSPINAGIWHAENAAPCTVVRDVTEVMSSFPTVTRPNSYRVTQQHAKVREGRQGAAALRYCCAIAFLEVSEFQQLPHGAITPHLYTGWFKRSYPHLRSSFVMTFSAKKCHINLAPIHSFYRVTFIFGNTLLWTVRGLR
jgi:hypothetical protein